MGRIKTVSKKDIDTIRLLIQDMIYNFEADGYKGHSIRQDTYDLSKRLFGEDDDLTQKAKAFI